MSRSTLLAWIILVSLCAFVAVFVFDVRIFNPRFATIECLSFSSDGSQIAVSRLDARDARTPMKFYKKDVSRTVSLLDTSKGDSVGLLHQDYKRGNCGPAFGLWWPGRVSAVFNPFNDRVLVTGFGGGDITQYVPGESAPRSVTSVGHPAAHITVSNSGRLFAASGGEEISVFDAESNKLVRRFHYGDAPFLHAAFMAFSNDESRLVMAGWSGVASMDFRSDSEPTAIIQLKDDLIEAIAVAPDDTLLVCPERGVHRYSFDGSLVAMLHDSIHPFALCVSADGRLAAAAAHEQIHVFDLSTNRESRSIGLDASAAISFSPDCTSLAVGVQDGRVVLIDTGTWQRRWITRPPGQ